MPKIGNEMKYSVFFSVKSALIPMDAPLSRYGNKMLKKNNPVRRINHNALFYCAFAVFYSLVYQIEAIWSISPRKR